MTGLLFAFTVVGLIVCAVELLAGRDRGES